MKIHSIFLCVFLLLTSVCAMYAGDLVKSTGQLTSFSLNGTPSDLYNQNKPVTLYSDIKTNQVEIEIARSSSDADVFLLLNPVPGTIETNWNVSITCADGSKYVGTATTSYKNGNMAVLIICNFNNIPQTTLSFTLTFDSSGS